MKSKGIRRKNIKQKKTKKAKKGEAKKGHPQIEKVNKSRRIDPCSPFFVPEYTGFYGMS